MNTTHTNPHELWDEYRDGALDGGDRRTFERYLSENPDLADRYGQETRLLAALKDDDGGGVVDGPDPAFREGVMDAWLAPKPIGFVRRYRAPLAAAASVAIVAGLVWAAGRHGPTDKPNDRPTRVVISGDRPDDLHAQDLRGTIDDTPKINPVSAMVLSVSNSAEAPSRQLRQTIAMARAMLSGDPLMELIEQHKPKQTPAIPEDDATPRS